MSASQACLEPTTAMLLAPSNSLFPQPNRIAGAAALQALLQAAGIVGVRSRNHPQAGPLPLLQRKPEGRAPVQQGLDTPDG